VITDIISGRQPEISLEGLFMDRYGSINKPVQVPSGIAVTA
jgi:D-amino-acid dehydrogenase